VIDRTNGKLIAANAFVPQNWAKGIDLKTGRPRTKSKRCGLISRAGERNEPSRAVRVASRFLSPDITGGQGRRIFPSLPGLFFLSKPFDHK
jgi:hypothetical protein